MSFELTSLTQKVQEHGAVIRILIANHAGSSPREKGTSMLVWGNGQSGTIGGGALEFEAVSKARKMLAARTPDQSQTIPLGPSLGQCCGGSVTLVWERFERTNLPNSFPFARAIETQAAPLALHRSARTDMPVLENGWLIEAACPPASPLWIWGAGHVGTALATVLGPLPQFNVHLIGISRAQMPEVTAPNVTAVIAGDMPTLAAHSPTHADHIIVTHSHKIDLALCHTLLLRGFGSLGLIGSATKWARFQNRLTALGHTYEHIMRIACPIGDPALGKLPQEIAIGVASALLNEQTNGLGKVSNKGAKTG